jgi:hypothetical protein
VYFAIERSHPTITESTHTMHRLTEHLAIKASDGALHKHALLGLSAVGGDDAYSILRELTELVPEGS